MQFGKLDTVKYLLQTGGVLINPADRWGSTPLNYASNGSSISLYLQSKGAKNGTAQPIIKF